MPTITAESCEGLETKMERLTGVVPPYAYLIYLMGPTGSGKSAFIESLSPNDSLSISKNSLESVTQVVTPYRFTSPSWEEQIKMRFPIVLVDTPGLLDSKMSEANVIKGLQEWQKQHVDLESSQETFSHLVMYFERITDKRMSGSKRRAVRIFKALLGPGSINRRVTVVTTMWNQISSDRNMAQALERYQQLQDDYWREEIDDGLETRKYEGTPSSALWILTQTLSIASNPSYPPGELSKGFAFQQVGVSLGKFNNHPEDGSAIRTIIYGDILERIAAVRMRLGMMDEELGQPESLDRRLKAQLKRDRKQALRLLWTFLDDLALLNTQDAEGCPIPEDLQMVLSSETPGSRPNPVRETAEWAWVRIRMWASYLPKCC